MMKGERTALIAVFVIRTHHTNGAVERSETISVYLRCCIDRDLSEILRFAQNDTRRWLFVILSGFDIPHSSFILALCSTFVCFERSPISRARDSRRAAPVM